MSATSIRVPTTFTANDKLTKVVKQMTAGVTKFTKAGIAGIKRFDHQVNKTFNKLGRLTQIGLGVGIGGLFALAIQNNIAYNDSLASVSAITGSTGKDLVLLEQLATNTAKSQKKLGSDVLKAYEVVGSAQPILLENSALLDKVTNSAITLSKASRLDLETSALALTDVMNQFNLTGQESNRVIDVLANGAKFGAAAIPLIKDSIVQFGTAAKAANVSLEQSVALVETMADKGIKGAEAGTKLRNVLSNMSAVKGLPPAALKQLQKYGVDTDLVSNKSVDFGIRLKELAKIAKDPVAMVKVFGKENQIAAGIVLNNISRYEDLTKKMAENGTATEQAKTNTNTLAFALGSIKTAFLNTTTATNSNNGALELVKNTLTFVANNMDTVVSIGVGLIAMYGVMKAVLIAAKIATFAHSVALGVQGAISGKASINIGKNAVALTAYKVAQVATTGVTWLATAATTAFGVALNLGLWPILAIIAAIVAVILIIKNWSKITEWFSEKWKQFTTWISGLWDKVVSWFKNFDFKQFFKEIGQSILKFMLMPMKGLLTLLSKVPGKIGEIASLGLEKIGNLTGELDVNDKREVIPSPEARSAEITNTNNSRSKVDINLNDPGGAVNDIQQSGDNDIPISLTNTQAAF